MDTTNNPSEMKIVKLDRASTGECPCGCGRAAFPYTTPGFEGYVDAAPECARAALADSMKGT